MKKFMFAAVLVCAILTQPFSVAAKKDPAAMPKVGALAPEFTLKYFDGNWPPKEVKLSDYRGKKQVILAFYVFAFTGG